jgi:hypothetical protein
MKKKSLIVFATVLLMAGYVFADVPVTFDASYVDADTSLIKNTFKAVLPNLSFAEADTIVRDICAYTGSVLFLDEQGDVENSPFYKTVDNAAVCKIDRATGDIFFRKYTDFDGSTPGLPAKRNAAALAKKHLKALGLYKNKMSDPIVTTLEEAVYDGQTTRTYEKLRVVTFRRKIGGLMVKGASRAVVMLGADGDLEGLVVRWMDVKTEKVKGKIARSQLKNFIKGKLKARNMEGDSVRVKKADLVLYDNGEGVIEPALQLQGEIATFDGAFPTDWMLPLITDPKASY